MLLPGERLGWAALQGVQRLLVPLLVPAVRSTETVAVMPVSSATTDLASTLGRSPGPMAIVAAAPSTLYCAAFPPRAVHAPPTSAVPHPPVTTRLNESDTTMVCAAAAPGARAATSIPVSPRETAAAAATIRTATCRREVACAWDAEAVEVIMAASSVTPTAGL